MLGASDEPVLSRVTFFLGTAGGGNLEGVGSCAYLEFAFFNCTLESSCEMESTDSAGVDLLLAAVPDFAVKLLGLGLTGGGGVLEPAKRP